VAPRQRRERAVLALDAVGLAQRLHHRPGELSGGEMQRVAIARALVIEPEVLLLDEPLSNLDARLRVEMRGEIRQLQQSLGITAVYVTHDQEEAMTIADRLAVFMDGRIVQVGTPAEVFARPASVAVAGFIGSPPMNLVAGRVADGVLNLDGSPVGAARVAGGCAEPVLGLRPEALRIGREASSSPALRCVVDVVEPMGHEVIIHGRIGSDADTELVARLDAHDEPRPGEVLELTFESKDLHLFDPASGERLRL